MTAPNHIAGGFVITGFFTSLYNINILADWKTIAVAVFAMLLPDIDHTKSVIGKIFYPISKTIGRKYGHRTITHSLLFLLTITAATYLLDLLNNWNYVKIVFFGILSHFVLDMITVSGIPLFYPFYKNRCVTPANQEFRLKTGNPKHEGLAFFVFAVLALFLQDLFKEGFWTTYNKQFSSIEHVEREYKSHNKVVQLHYDYNIYEKNYKGTAVVLYARPNELHLFNKTFFVLKKTTGVIINNLDFETLNNQRITEKISFAESIDSLNSFLSNKYVIQGNLFFSSKVSWNDKESQTFKISQIFSPQFHSIDTYKEKEAELRQKIMAQKEQRVADKKKLKALFQEKNQLQQKLKTIKNKPYELEMTTKKIIALKKQIESFQVQSVSTKTLAQLKSLKETVSVRGTLWLFKNLSVN